MRGIDPRTSNLIVGEEARVLQAFNQYNIVEVEGTFYAPQKR